jgi:phage-related tail protein
VVKDQATSLSQGAAEAGKHTAETVREQASNVTAEAGRQGRDLLRQAQGQLREQAGQQQQRLAGDLRAVSDELAAMAGQPDHPGVAADLARQAAGTTRNVARWLDDRDPGQLLEDVKGFARQRPGVFLALAAGAGLLAGRLTRGLAAEAHDGGTSAAAGGTAYSRPAQGTPAEMPAVDAGSLPPSGQSPATTAGDGPLPSAGVPRAEGTL